MGDTEHQILRPSFRPPTPSLSTSSDRSSTVSSNVNSASSAPSFSTSSFADRINRKTLKNLHTPNIIFGNENLYTSNQTSSRVSTGNTCTHREPFRGKSGVIIDPSRAGMPSSLLSQRAGRKIVPNLGESRVVLDRPRLSKRVFDEGRKSDPVAQQDQSNPKFNMVRRSSVKNFNLPEPREDRSHFTKPGRPPRNPHVTPSALTAQPLPGGGFFPENSRPGLKSSTIEGFPIRPPDNTDVIKYKHAGKLNSPVRNDRKTEQQRYREVFNEALRSNSELNSDMYHYLRARTTYTSPSLTDFLYEVRERN